MNSKKRCKSCKEFFPTEEVVTTNLGSFCTSCFGCAEKRYPAKISKPKRAKRKRSRVDMPVDVKNSVRNRDGWRCRWCGSQNLIEVHHIKYKSQGGTDEEYNLITLCKQHHEKAHSNKRAWQKTLQLSNWCYIVENKRNPVTMVARQLVGISTPDLELALERFWAGDLSQDHDPVDLVDRT